ncbi:uncharacterized protein Z518_07395 [Rhinocladiella mackenziei CBS 650.93]|uniref:Uncharacterized protein n=1 Tax=Rhinocladiella mackenziei CBS 650.93 TaxID=1442369 RepID=A0A0D2FNZ5_9EURO|nr:uncharacterized protein Z518_07395 [Rhinocladiella mackenziei CBS 650.93]KIX03842.1 hypothetical protein Z518_07395 [Rhinocladiella mackenziei CBS 650.93]
MLAQSLRLSFFYFWLVFMAGLFFGSIRVPFLQPALGTRYAELLEMPIMVVMMWQSAQLTLWQLEGGHSGKHAFLTPVAIGALALLWLMIVELATTAILKGGWWNGVKVYFAGRDSVAGPVYALAVLAYAVMPWYIWYNQKPDEDKAMWEVDKAAVEEDEYCNRG